MKSAGTFWMLYWKAHWKINEKTFENAQMINENRIENVPTN